MPLSKIVPVRLCPDMDDVLTDICLRYRVSRSEFIRHALSRFTRYLAYEGEYSDPANFSFEKFLRDSDQNFP